MLSIKNLTKKYGDFTAVDDLSLEINPGEICGFIGHNGAGKTTTIRCCCGLLDFEAGEILINGKNVREDPVACKKDLAYIPDNPTLFEYLSGIQYLNFVADIYGIDKQTR
ncbi:MAG: ATP-binding cassette domain-containing protein, partial [Erysipelotrichaceae bacterium]|nr:ATP-binding cassette domain-containing protein [Erysipelotrichaceae bacterium]